MYSIKHYARKYAAPTLLMLTIATDNAMASDLEKKTQAIEQAITFLGVPLVTLGTIYGVSKLMEYRNKKKKKKS